MNTNKRPARENKNHVRKRVASSRRSNKNHVRKRVANLRRSGNPAIVLNRRGASMQFNKPLAYLITIVTYGTWLHGDDRGSVDRNHNIHGTPTIQPDEALQRHRRERLKHPPTKLDAGMRGAVDAAIREVCKYRGWELTALNVRTNHVHVVVASPKSADDVLRDFKAYATRRIRRNGLAPASQEIWADGGSKRMLYTRRSVERAARYVAEAQGPDLPMDCIQGDEPEPSA